MTIHSIPCYLGELQANQVHGFLQSLEPQNSASQPTSTGQPFGTELSALTLSLQRTNFASATNQLIPLESICRNARFTIG